MLREVASCYSQFVTETYLSSGITALLTWHYCITDTHYCVADKQSL